MIDIRQGDIFWIDLEEPSGSGPGYRRPYVVIQNNFFNNSTLRTVVVCAISTNLKLAKLPENVLLEKGEANLARQSVVNVTQLFTVDKRELAEKIGTLTLPRIRQILKGLRLLTEPKRHQEL